MRASFPRQVPGSTATLGSAWSFGLAAGIVSGFGQESKQRARPGEIIPGRRLS